MNEDRNLNKHSAADAVLNFKNKLSSCVKELKTEIAVV